jgi:peptidoglycan/LPS O-acetylase OafA/YrhL
VFAALLWAIHVVGAYGVELFFLLSSYLITRLLLKEVDNTGRLDLRAFYVRRTLRIWPLYFFFLALCSGLAHAGFGVIPNDFMLTCVFFVSNWYLMHKFVWMPLALLWTLSIEEQFYVCWPLLMRGGRRKHIALISWATIALSQAVIFWLHATGTRMHNPLFNNTFTEVQFFGIGALLAVWADGSPINLSRKLRVVVGVSGLLFLMLAALFDPIHPTLSAGAFSYNLLFLFCAIGVVLLFRAVVGSSSRWYPKWLLFLGKISYGLYIFNLFATYFTMQVMRGHFPIAFELPVVVVLNLLLAICSYFLIEKPFLRLKRRFEVVRSRPVESGAPA